MKIQRLVILLLSLFFATTAFAQKSCVICGDVCLPKGEDICESCKELYIPATEFVHDTTKIYLSNLEDITRELGMSFDEYVRAFLKFKDERDTSNQFQTDKIYLNYFLPLLNTGQDIFKSRIATREFVIKPSEATVNLDLTCHPQAFALENSELLTDCMLSIYGQQNTNTFLKSPSQIRSCLGQLFTHIYNANGKIKGINFYFPDYSFKEKRAMAQFLKSVSIIIDSSKVQSIKELKFYVSFNKDIAKNKEPFLFGISQMTDSIFLLNYTAETNTLPEISVVDKLKAQGLNVFYKLQNQLYLARYFTEEFPKTSTEFNVADIYNSMKADYTDNDWEFYLYSIIATILVVLILVTLYLVNPSVSYFVYKNIDYVYSLMIMIFLEVLILLANMFEFMSKDDVFSLNNDNRYIILLLPLLFIFIIPMMKAIGKKRQVP